MGRITGSADKSGAKQGRSFEPEALPLAQSLDFLRPKRGWRRVAGGIFSQRFFLLFFIVLSMGLALVALMNFTVWNAGTGRIYTVPEEVPNCDTALVLGTSKVLKDGQINLFYLYRMQAAAVLYHAGKVKYLLVSGDNRESHYNETDMMRQSLMELGVPESAIRMDFAGFRTLDSVVRARNVFHLKKYIVVSQEFHCRRAIYIAQRRGMDVYGFAARDCENPVLQFKVFCRETLARPAAWLDINVLNRQPHFPQ